MAEAAALPDTQTPVKGTKSTGLESQHGGGGSKQEDQEFKVVFSYTVNPRPAWAYVRPRLKTNNKTKDCVVQILSVCPMLIKSF